MQTLLMRFIWPALMVVATGCRTTAPIYVWCPSEVATQPHSMVAVTVLSGDPLLSAALEAAVLEQRPAVRSDVAVITSVQLVEAAPVQWASTAPPAVSLNSDLSAIRAAQSAGADLLLFGQVYSCDIDWNRAAETPKPVMENANRAFFQRLGLMARQDPGYHIMLSWNVIDVPTGKSLGSQEFRLDSAAAERHYPDLHLFSEEKEFQLLTAAARETWKSVAPSVEKVEVRLARPFFQPGAWQVRRGVRAAKDGQWALAETYWNRVASWPWVPTPAAHHNLAIAMVAREDFTSAKEELLKADGPLSIRLPEETLVWLDRHHRLYHQAHRLADPANGWAFPQGHDPMPSDDFRTHPIDENQLPWWGGLPGIKYRPKSVSEN